MRIKRKKSLVLATIGLVGAGLLGTVRADWQSCYQCWTGQSVSYYCPSDGPCEGGCWFDLYSSPVSQCIYTGSWLDACNDHVVVYDPPVLCVNYADNCSVQTTPGGTPYCVCGYHNPMPIGWQHISSGCGNPQG
jgi:hypothetical protein